MNDNQLSQFQVDLQSVADRIVKLTAEKNEAYGNSFNESYRILEAIYPNGISIDQYDDMLAICRVIDKLFRIAHRKNAFGENPWNDIAGYALLGSVKK